MLFCISRFAEARIGAYLNAIVPVLTAKCDAKEAAQSETIESCKFPPFFFFSEMQHFWPFFKFCFILPLAMLTEM